MCGVKSGGVRAMKKIERNLVEIAGRYGWSCDAREGSNRLLGLDDLSVSTSATPKDEDTMLRQVERDIRRAISRAQGSCHYARH